MLKLLTGKQRQESEVSVLKIKIITVGKLKEKYLVQGINEYLKRLQKYAKVEIIELADEKAPENLSEAEMLQVKTKEGERILAKISDQEYVFALAINGKQYSSEEFSKEIEQLGINGKSQLVFIIGGSLGLSEEVLNRSQKQISFGRLTYPHQLMRLVLVEQIYRGFRIMRGEPYHK
jgi:23S rRNA (pseudouridine1915-N3)-methyltransferase